MAVLDRRLAAARYGRTLLASLPPAPLTRSLDDVARFFGPTPPGDRLSWRVDIHAGGSGDGNAGAASRGARHRPAGAGRATGGLRATARSGGMVYVSGQVPTV